MFISLAQYSGVAFLILRLIIGIIFVYHAVPKLKNTKEKATGMGLPAWVVFGTGIVEILASLALVIGFPVQYAVLLLSLIMIGAIYMKIVRWHVPFSAHDKTGWEFDLLLLAINAFIFVAIW